MCSGYQRECRLAAAAKWRFVFTGWAHGKYVRKWIRVEVTTRRCFIQTASAALVLQSGSAAQADPDLVKAMDAVRAAIPTAEADPQRPRYHFRPPANWTNDPNGTIYYKGWHHLFYQLNPFAARIGSQHWGHARSRNLVNWEHLPIAIWPSANKGERFIFSGGAALAA